MSVYRIFSAVIFITFLAFSFGKSSTFASSQPVHSLGGGIVVVIEDVTYCVRFSPNPSTDDLIHCEAIESVNNIELLEITGLNGELLLSQSCNATACSIDVSSLAAGNYWIEVSTADCHARYMVQITR